MENEMHFKSNNVIKDGSCRDTYEGFKDEPEAGQKPPPKEEKSGFNWGGLLMAAAAAVATFGIGAAIVGAVAAACIGAICSSSAAATAAGVQSAMGALAISSCAAVCGAVLWDNSNSDEEDIEGFSYYEKIPKYHLSLKRLRDSKGFFETAKNLGIFAFDRTLGFFGELNTQLALNMGIDPEWAEATGECSSGMLAESFIAVSIVGIRAAQAVRSGKAISSGDTIVGSGIGNVAKNGRNTVERSAKVDLELNPFNEAGKLKPNIKYKAGEFDYLYETDGMGRINKFETENLKLTERESRLPHNPDTPGKIDGDHAGHLAGDRFGGSPELDNLVSQSSNVNLSQYKKIENQWAKSIKEVKQVKVNVEVKYDGNSLRPSKFNVEYEIDGEVFSKNLLN